VARQSPQRHNADEPDPEHAGADQDMTGRALWEEIRIDPVEVALPAGVGYTLRAYRPVSELTPTDVEGREEDDPFAARRIRRAEEDEERVVILDEEFAALAAEDETDRTGRRGPGDEGPVDREYDETSQVAEEPEAEEVPVFLSHRGRLLLFKSPESLVAFIRSDAPHDLAQVDTWPRLAERVRPADINPLDEDSYELDLVVENLRGGHDAWDITLLVEAGELARDLGYALRIEPVLTALSPGSPLDDLDEALRAAAAGGVGGFLGRRRLRKIGAQQASLGWRTIIGKISAAVDWRD
jgi:hypothetical protein